MRKWEKNKYVPMIKLFQEGVYNEIVEIRKEFGIPDFGFTEKRDPLLGAINRRIIKLNLGIFHTSPQIQKIFEKHSEEKIDLKLEEFIHDHGFRKEDRYLIKFFLFYDIHSDCTKLAPSPIQIDEFTDEFNVPYLEIKIYPDTSGKEIQRLLKDKINKFLLKNNTRKKYKPIDEKHFFIYYYCVLRKMSIKKLKERFPQIKGDYKTLEDVKKEAKIIINSK